MQVFQKAFLVWELIMSMWQILLFSKRPSNGAHENHAVKWKRACEKQLQVKLRHDGAFMDSGGREKLRERVRKTINYE